MLDMPIAIVSLVDKNRIWFKSHYGIDLSEIGTQPGLCSSAILSDELYLVKDARKDPRTINHPLVVNKFALRFYAAYPLRTREGYNIGTFCVLDKKPRHFTHAKREILKMLSEMVIDYIELRLEAKMAKRHHHDILNITAHQLKNPLAMMPLLSDMIIHHKDKPEAIDDIADQIKNAGKRMSTTIENLLEDARDQLGNIHLRRERLDMGTLLKGIYNTSKTFAKNKQQDLLISVNDPCIVYGDPRRLTEVIDNIINNAIKFSPLASKIEVILQVKNKKAVLQVKDEGPGLTKDDKKKLFQAYSSLSAQPTGGESSTGLGLSIAKNLVLAHRGKIYAESKGINKGSTFTVELPVLTEKV